MADLHVIDVSFPHSTGRVAKVIGNQTSAETSLSISLSGRIYLANRAAAQTWINSVQSARLSTSSMLATLTFADGSFTSMRLTQFQTGPIKAVRDNGTIKVSVSWTGTWSQYA